jgi:hypothetical protein
MASAPAHKFGQMIGDMLEAAVRPMLEDIAKEHELFLDAKGKRVVRGKKTRVVWADGKDNHHALDYVLEIGGTEESIGSPAAFIEIAYRRYTKHSRNKAQEIQGAILPLAERYGAHHPFLGAILGGVFTDASVAQLRSHGFTVLYFEYESIIAAFSSVGIDASYDEGTPDSVIQRKISAFRKLNSSQRDRLANAFRTQHASEVGEFSKKLRAALTRKISLVYVLPLHGTPQACHDVNEALAFIQSFDESATVQVFTRYEVDVRIRRLRLLFCGD